jgi:hypothetical protein
MRPATDNTFRADFGSWGMSYTGSMPRLTRASEIPTTSCDSRLASAARSPLILSMRVWVPSSSAERSCPSGGCRPRSCSSANVASHTSRFVYCRQRWIWYSSSVRLRSVSCLDQELDMHARAKKCCWTASARTWPKSRSMTTFPRVC